MRVIVHILAPLTPNRVIQYRCKNIAKVNEADMIMWSTVNPSIIPGVSVSMQLKTWKQRYVVVVATVTGFHLPRGNPETAVWKSATAAAALKSWIDYCT